MRLLLIFVFLAGCSSAKRDLRDQEFFTPLIDPRDVRALFVGDSITASWPKATQNRNTGIPGAGAEIIGRRFAAEINQGSPKYVHILVGTNDVGGNRDAQSIATIASMVEAAKARRIHTIVGTVPPIDRLLFPNIAPHVPAFNMALIAEVKPRGAIIADYYKAMVLPDGNQNSSLFADGIHPNRAGYMVMRQVLQDARRELRITRRAERKESGITRTPEQRAARQAQRAERQERRAERLEKRAERQR
jgi:lysophospholipase L1-like esterase